MGRRSSAVARGVAMTTVSGIIALEVVSLTTPHAGAQVEFHVASASARLHAVDRAEAAGLAKRTKTWAAAPVDYDRDGDQDVWIGYHGGGGGLWRNNGKGRYRRVATRAWPKHNDHGKIIDRHDCDWADVDRNGRPDTYCSTGRFRSNKVKHGRDNELWMQSRRGKFRDVADKWGVGLPCGRGRHVTFVNVNANANGDRWPDLFVGNENPRHLPDPCNRRHGSPRNEQSRLFVNMHGRGFRSAPKLWNYGSGPGTNCAEVLDFDGDGSQDLLTCRSRGESLRLYRNRQGHGFANVTAAHRLDAPVNDASVADLDHDGDPDLVTARHGQFTYHLNANGHYRPPVTIGRPARGNGHSVAVGDADKDGDLDIYGLAAAGGGNPDDTIWLASGLTGDPTYTRIHVPSAHGKGESVQNLDPRGNGRTEFLVLNGYGRALAPGRIQLIRVSRR